MDLDCALEQPFLTMKSVFDPLGFLLFYLFIFQEDPVGFGSAKERKRVLMEHFPVRKLKLFLDARIRCIWIEDFIRFNCLNNFRFADVICCDE